MCAIPSVSNILRKQGVGADKFPLGTDHNISLSPFQPAKHQVGKSWVFFTGRSGESKGQGLGQGQGQGQEQGQGQGQGGYGSDSKSKALVPLIKLAPAPAPAGSGSSSLSGTARPESSGTRELQPQHSTPVCGASQNSKGDFAK